MKQRIAGCLESFSEAAPGQELPGGAEVAKDGQALPLLWRLAQFNRQERLKCVNRFLGYQVGHLREASQSPGPAQVIGESHLRPLQETIWPIIELGFQQSFGLPVEE